MVKNEGAYDLIVLDALILHVQRSNYCKIIRLPAKIYRLNLLGYRIESANFCKVQSLALGAIRRVGRGKLLVHDCASVLNVASR